MSIKFLESSVYRSDRDLTREEYIADSPNCMNIDGSDLFSIRWNENFQWTQIKRKLSHYPS